MKISCFTFFLFMLLAVQSSAQEVKKGLRFAENFADLPFLKTGTQTYQYSSTDPGEDQFNDYSHWLYADKDSGAVLADIKGPGAIYRIWSTGNVGDTNRIKIYIDGEENPRINQTFNEFHDHKPLRDRPQVGSGAGDNYLAWWSYMPIPFRKSIKIVRQGNFRPFYNITYHTYTTPDGVDSWTGKENLREMEQMWNNPEKDPKSSKGNITTMVRAGLKAGKSADIFNYKGAGYIAVLKISHFPPDKNLRLRIYWDGEKLPSVDAPVKWFFGSVDNGGDTRALGVGTVDNNGYCYFPMPFWKSARIELINLSDKDTPGMDITVGYNLKQYPKALCGYFKAKANEVDKPDNKYTCLKTEGRGHVIGMAKRMPAGGHACEGDEIYYIDNRRFPDIYGTGEEDYANCAWWKNKYNSYPTHGCVGNDCYYRIHYPDVLVYEQAFDMEFETWENFYTASLVWYYQKDKISLIATDSLDVMNNLSEQAHHYKVKGANWTGKKTGQYPGKRIYQYSISDDGRRFNGYSQFTVAINRKNNGVRLRLRTDQNMQGVNIWVDGKLVKERPWIIMKNNFDAIWVDADYEIPENYTRGKGTITIKLTQIPSYKDWTEYRYTVYSYL
jgi:hypothetical protein